MVFLLSCVVYCSVPDFLSVCFLFLTFFPSSVVYWAVYSLLIVCFMLCIVFEGSDIVVPILYLFPDHHFLLLYYFLRLLFLNVLPTPLINKKTMSTMVVVEIIMSNASIDSRYGKRW